MLQIRLVRSCVWFAALLTLGNSMGCDALGGFFGQVFPGPAGAAVPPGLARVRVRVENQSGFQAAVEAVFYNGSRVIRRTELLLDPTGPDSTAVSLWTQTARVTVRAVVAEESTAAVIAPGGVLAETEFRLDDDFTGGETLLFTIPAPQSPPLIIDCNGNGVNDAQDIAAGEPSAAARVRPPMALGNPSNLLFPLDGSYTLAMAPNDDGSSAVIPLGFEFNLYGTAYTECYINNNGNISFGGPFSTFTSTGFPVSSFPMVAPFWADVDTRGGFGDVWYKIQDNTLIVIWNSVGYFLIQGDKLNTFEVAISDGLNPVIGLGANVAFSYDDMQWTTGSASSGVGGFGGTPATVGANEGNGTDFFQIGRFDHAGTDYDGPDGNSDGISFLDNQTFRFSASTTTTNIPPIPLDFPATGTVTLAVNFGDVLDLTIQFISPEAGQTTTVDVADVNGAVPAGLAIVSTPGNVATVDLAWSPDCSAVGSYVLDFTATDDFDPPGVTEVSLQIDVHCRSQDCNGNGIPDECDIADGTSADCDGNRIPDECDADCNTNGTPDACELCPTTQPVTWAESGDAGDLPGTAQVPVDVGLLESITGTIGGGCDADVYQIYVNNGPAFSASTATNGGSADFDTQLFLFDASGIGVYTNDDFTGAFPWTSHLPAGHALSPPAPGIYYLAITGWRLDPVSAGGPIFPNPDDDPGVFGPTAAGGGSPVTGWDDGGMGCESGSYMIALTGAGFVGSPCSSDCNSNGIPDECDPDCDGDGIPDDCESDCDDDGVPDDCDPDSCLG